VSPEPEMAERPVPHNRWDLIPDGPADPPPTVSVVVVHYEQDRALARVLHALGRQSALPFEIVVADDGSRTPPVLPDLPVPARVVTQPDLGFRAAAARNAGARVCRGDILVFLDADTTPEETCLAQLTRRVGRCRDVLAVGRRRHADLSHLPVDADPASAPGLVEPEWLRSGYAQTRDLLDADGRSFRFVISAVMACRRDLYRDLGGFDERFVGYGGEDWDFAYRAWNAGAVLVHEPEAVAWHDGPGWADRPSSADTPDRQSARLAALIPEPSTRGVALPGRIPDVLADLDPSPGVGAIGGGTSPVGTTERCVHSLLRQSFRDLRVRLPPPADPAVAELYDGGTQACPWSGDQIRRARARLVVHRPLPANAVADAMRLITDDDIGTVEILTSGVRAAREAARVEVRVAARWGDRSEASPLIVELFGCRQLEVGPAPPERSTLAGWFESDPTGGSTGHRPPQGS
jgi:GT2 family glycosyltransferase